MSLKVIKYYLFKGAIIFAINDLMNLSYMKISGLIIGIRNFK